jgi:hypothetical protein
MELTKTKRSSTYEKTWFNRPDSQSGIRLPDLRRMRNKPTWGCDRASAEFRSFAG